VIPYKVCLNFPDNIDLLINDNDHSAEYEYQEYRAVVTKLTEGSIVLGDNAHVTPMLAKFGAETGRDFIIFHEVHREHWYPGAGIGIALG
jgi:hypothetical protein